MTQQYKLSKIKQREEKTEKEKKEQSISELWDNFKHPKIRTTREMVDRINNVKKIMVEIFPNMMKTTNPQIQKSPQASSRRNKKTPIPKHIIINLLKTNDKTKY